MSLTRPILLALAAVSLAACNGHGNHFNLISAGDTSINNGAIRVDDGVVTLHPDHTADASIASNGDFSIDGRPVTITPNERSLLQAYYAGALHVREHGIETGKAGTAVAGDALKNAADQVLGGDDAAAERNRHVADKVKQAALKICDDLADIRAAQDQLATQLDAFKPYGQLLDADSVSECRDQDD